MEDSNDSVDETVYEDFTEVDIEGVMVDGGVSFELALTYGVIEIDDDEVPLEDDVMVVDGVFVMKEDTVDVKSGEADDDILADEEPER